MKNCYLLKIAICAIFLSICMLVICILFYPCTDFKSSEISCRKFRCNDFILIHEADNKTTYQYGNDLKKLLQSAEDGDVLCINTDDFKVEADTLKFDNKSLTLYSIKKGCKYRVAVKENKDKKEMENKYFEKIENIEKPDLKWCGNDNTTRQRNHNGKVSNQKNIITMKLSWKTDSEETFVGFFKLNLENLLKDGYIKIDSDPNYYRLNIYHDYNDNIVIKKMGNNKQIILGKI